MSKEVFKTGPFQGVDIHDAFASSASSQEPVVVDLGPIPWPANLTPTPAPLGNYSPGEKITGPLDVQADALIVLYTEFETQALLDVFTQDNDWSAARRQQWCGYAHNFANFKPIITGISGDTALEQGMFGYLSAVKIGTKTVVLFKSELHPKVNGDRLPFVPVIQQLVGELAPALVISTGTAGAIGSTVNCGDVAITSAARFHCQVQYPTFPDIDTMSANHTELTNNATVNTQYVNYAAANLTKLSLPGLSQCYNKLQALPGYSFVKRNTAPPAIYVTGKNPVPGPQPMAIASADYLTVDDNNNSEGLQSLGIMNDTDDAFAFYAIGKLAANKPAWLSVRNASEPQIVAAPFPPGTSTAEIVDALKRTAGSIYGIYQYCTTLNSAFACWGIVAGM
ncbi:MAG: hypothetical protein ABSF64_22820 [Bryobacteraceae bacterium]|jgi:hypothetical protein